MSFPEQQQKAPGVQARMDPVPDCGENSYRGTGKLSGKRAVITGGDSGIGRAVAIAYAAKAPMSSSPTSTRMKTPKTSPATSRMPAANAFWYAAICPIRLTVAR